MLAHSAPLGTLRSLCVTFGQKSRVFKEKQWPPKYHMKFRSNGTPTPCLENIPKKYHFLDCFSYVSYLSLNCSRNNSQAFLPFHAGKFLNYWMTRTVTTTAYSYTVGLTILKIAPKNSTIVSPPLIHPIIQVTSKMASLACTPQGFPYLRCSGF